VSEPEYGPDSFISIAGEGYSRVFEHLKPMALMTLPASIFLAILMVFMWMGSYKLGVQTPNYSAQMWMTRFQPLNQIFGILSALCEYYVMFTLYRYAKDIYLKEPVLNWTAYMVPDKRLGIFIGVGLLLGLAQIFAGALICLGFLLLVLPGLALFVGFMYVMSRFSETWTCYIQNPPAGVVNAFATSWVLTENNVWRTIGLFSTLIVIKILIALPCVLIMIFANIVMAVMSMIFRFPMDSPVLAILILLPMFILLWSQFALGLGGMVFALYRYYFDLLSRRPAAYNNGHG